MSEQKRYWVFDLDGTICEQTGGGDEYATAKPKWDVIGKMSYLKAIGDHITIFTARGMVREGSKAAAESRYLEMTQDWLGAHGVSYDELMFGKPAAHYYVDDKGLRPDELSLIL